MGRKPSGAIRTDRVIQKKKNGDRYVYERQSKYAQEKGYYIPISSVCLGKMKPGSDDKYDLIPLRHKARNSKVNQSDASVKANKQHTGMISIVRHISEQSGIENELKQVISQDEGLVQKILTLAWYSFATDGRSWTGIYPWSVRYNNQLPYTAITSDMYHDAFVELGKDESIKQGIFTTRVKDCGVCNLIALDSATIVIETKRSGKCRTVKHKDGTFQKCIKVVFFYSIDARQPIAFATIPGNVTDSQTITYALQQLKGLPLDNAELVDDNGYCTDETICEMLAANRHFVTRIEADISWVSAEIEKVRDVLEHGGEIVEYDPNYSGKKVQVTRTFSKRGRKKEGETTSVTREVNLFIFFSSVNKAKDDVYFRETFISYAKDLKSGKALEDDRQAIEAFAGKYMNIERDSTGKITKITTQKKNYDKRLRYSGYIVLVADQETDIESALMKFRKREYVEEMIKNYEGHIGGKKTRVWDNDTLEGQLLVQFEALSMHETFESKVNYMKTTLALPTGSKDHDKAEIFKRERELKKWVEKTSLHNILEWFDAVESVNPRVNDHALEWTAAMSKRDELFLEMLGMNVNEISQLR